MKINDNDPRLLAWSALVESFWLVIRAIEANIKNRTPLSLEEYDLLLGVSRSRNAKIRLSDLAEVTTLTRSGVTRIVDRLVDRGLVSKEECAEDRRGAFAVLTDAGREAMKETWREYSREILKNFGENFSRAEAEHLQELLERVIGSLRGTSLVKIGRSSTQKRGIRKSNSKT